MKISKPSKQGVIRETKDYLMIALGMILYGIGWTLFLLPNDITTGGVPGIASIVYFATGFPVQYTYFAINAVLLMVSLKVLGFRFSLKTIFGVFILTFFLSIIQKLTANVTLLHDQPFMACVLGASFCGSGIGIAFSANGSTGGTDIIAAVINKYRDITLGRVMLICDLIIISSSYFVLKDWENVVYGYVTLCAGPGGEQCTTIRTILHYLQQVRRNRQTHQRISTPGSNRHQCNRVLYRQRAEDDVRPGQETGINHYLPVDKRL